MPPMGGTPDRGDSGRSAMARFVQEARAAIAGDDERPESSVRAAASVDLLSLATTTAGAVFLLSVLRLAWVSDDAFITIRSVEHLLAGEGFGPNPGVRVQAFTSALWALLCVPLRWMTGDPYGTLVLAGLLCSLVLTVLLGRGLRPLGWRAPIVLSFLAASTSFVEFSTSGLENSLTHLLAAAFCLERLRRGNRPTVTMFALAGALFLTRFDLALLAAPSVVIALVASPRDALRRAVAPAGAVGAWLAFATLYYGFPQPNTALAKLNVVLPWASKLGRGFEYALDIAARDPLVVLVFVLASALVLRRGVSRPARGLQLGAVSYFAYLTIIGGDFMSGRFFTAIYLVSVLVLVEVCGELLAAPRVAVAVAVPLGLAAALVFFGEGGAPKRTECHVPITGVVNERACYAEHTALAHNLASAKWRTHGYLADFKKALAREQNGVVAFELVGMAAYGGDRKVHIVERFALSDPLLARIRVSPEGRWRAGHFLRELPAGYLRSLRMGENHLKDPCIRALYDDLDLITRGPLWSKERLAAIWRLNTERGVCTP